MSTMISSDETDRAVVIVGLGNIGSYLVDHLARMPDLKRITLIDFDRYEGSRHDNPSHAGNFYSQCVGVRDLGQRKVTAQARRLKSLRPDVEVVPLAENAADIPMGYWRSDVILAALDSMEARLTVNQASWRLGVPWVDAGIDPEDKLIRIQAYQPGAQSPCMECALEAADYEALGTRHSCSSISTTVTPTQGPPCLGGIAAGFLASECRKIIDGQERCALFGRQLILDIQHHRHILTRYSLNPRCRFDHATWLLQDQPQIHIGTTLGTILTGQPRNDDATTADTVAVEGKQFVRAVVCTACGLRRRCFCLEGRLPRSLRICAHCRKPSMQPIGFGSLDELSSELEPRLLRKTLGQIGLRARDILRLNSATRRIYLETSSKPM